ncbi:MAG: tRNA lysidine(34) synthetase TilS [Chitinophagaceae bacterium]
MNLLSQFHHFIHNENLFQSKDRLLIAVSGGVDSIVLCELCKLSGYNFAIAHCNFQLRGAESERDEEFVRALATKYNVPFFTKRFETEAYAGTHKCSIQVAARELRYHWFEEIVSSELSVVSKSPYSPLTTHHSPFTTHHSPTYLLTAHHANDNIETLLMNFFKGTGITGLRGILPKQGNIVRPLLFATKEELKKFAEDNQLQWVEDSSNAEDHYTRNYIRHKVIPLLGEIYPQVESNLAANLQRFRETEYLYRQHLDQLLNKLVETKGGERHIPILKLKKTNAARTVLFELMHPLGFTAKQSEEALGLLDSESGRYIASATHRILRNRNWLILAPLATTEARHILIEAPGSFQFAAGNLKLSCELRAASVEQNSHPTPNIALLDASDIRFPLLLRPWKAGDYFYPLGMKKKKKLARFFIDQKLSATDKEKVWVLEMDKKIIWVVGMRIDERFRLTEQTGRVLRLEFLAASYEL